MATAGGDTRTEHPPEGASASKNGEGCVPGAAIADVLRLLSTGATGAVLMALGDGPLRTKQLTERVSGYTPRTIYRYTDKLTKLEIIEREEEPGVPSKVVHSLTDPCGRELHDLIDRFATAAMLRLPDGRVDVHAWASLGLLADLWETGIVDELSCEPRSSTELAKAGRHSLSYHQVNRRAGLLRTAGLVDDWDGPGRTRWFALTEKTRRTMGFVAGLARWRDRNAVVGYEEEMTAVEMAWVLRASLPLMQLPDHAGKSLRLNIVGGDEPLGGEGEDVWASLKGDGAVHSCGLPTPSVDAGVRGKVRSWIPVALHGDMSRLQFSGDEKLARTCLTELHDVLWPL